MPSSTFMKITNKDIYDKIGKIETIINEFKIVNQTEHEEIKEHQIRTNGKVKLSRWVATTALSLVLLCLGFLVNLLN